MRKQTKRAIVNIIKEFDGLFLISVILLCIALIHFDNETERNTYSIDGVVSSVELTNSFPTQLITFKIDDTDCYYMIRDSKWDRQEAVFESYKELAASGKRITAIVSEDTNVFLDAEYNVNVIAVAGETENCFLLSSHNAYQTFARIALIVISLPGFIITFFRSTK